MFDVLNITAPTKTVRVGKNTNEWFDGETAAKIAAETNFLDTIQRSKEYRASFN